MYYAGRPKRPILNGNYSQQKKKVELKYQDRKPICELCQKHQALMLFEQLYSY
jgi:hypothetical protein